MARKAAHDETRETAAHQCDPGPSARSVQRGHFVDDLKLGVLIGEYGTIVRLAADIGCTEAAIHNWKQSGKIGKRNWQQLVELFGQDRMAAIRISDEEGKRREAERPRFPTLKFLNEINGLVDQQCHVSLLGEWRIDLRFAKETGIEFVEYPLAVIKQDKALLAIRSHDDPDLDVEFSARGFTFDEGKLANVHYRVDSEGGVAIGNAIVGIDDEGKTMSGHFIGSHSHYRGKLMRGEIKLTKQTATKPIG